MAKRQWNSVNGDLSTETFSQRAGHQACTRCAPPSAPRSMVQSRIFSAVVWRVGKKEENGGGGTGVCMWGGGVR